MASTVDFAARIGRARSEMRTHGTDCLLLSVGSDLPYLTGYTAMPLERLTMLVVTEHDATLVVPELEAPRVGPGPFDIHPWGETEHPIEIVTRLAGRPTIAAIGDQTWAVFLVQLLSRMPETTFLPASTVMSELRIIKSEREIANLAAAGAAVDRVLARIPEEVRFGGRTERQVSRSVIDMTLEEGHETAQFWIVASGPNAASPHHEPGERVIEEGDVVIVDFGGRLNGYCSDVSRTFSVGEPSDKAVEVHAVVAEAQAAGRRAATVGTPCEDVDAACRRVIEDAGYGEYFIHRTGHGIGMDGHEEPYLVEGNRRPLESGMAFSIEPGIYLPGDFGVRIEDICVANDAGADVLNRADRSLVVVD
jgi:Xaa-Pro aminopeptidase